MIPVNSCHTVVFGASQLSLHLGGQSERSGCKRLIPPVHFPSCQHWSPLWTRARTVLGNASPGVASSQVWTVITLGCFPLSSLILLLNDFVLQAVRVLGDSSLLLLYCCVWSQSAIYTWVAGQSVRGAKG